jgi:hypothetical protein
MNQVSSAFEVVRTITGVSLDILVLAILFVALAAYAFYFGKNKLIAFILAFYPAILLFQAFPYTENLTFWRGSADQVVFSKLLIFLVFFILLNVVLLKVVSGEFAYSRSGKFFQVGILALSGVIILLAFSHYFLPLKGMYTFSSATEKIFAIRDGVFWWFLVPLVGVFISNRHG